MSRLRCGAAMLAVTCLVVGLGPSASAKASFRKPCPARTICLYPDKNLGGERREYHCLRFRRGTHLTLILKRSFDPGRGGVSSYKSNGVPTARLVMLVARDRARLFALPRNTSGNIPRKFNDRAVILSVIC